MDACPKIGEVEAFVAGEVSAEDKARFEAHLASCSRCRSLTSAIEQDQALAQGIQQAYEGIAVSTMNTSAELGSDERSSVADSIEGYEILHEIHRGGQGVVYKAVQLATKRTVALKVLLQGPYASPKQQHRFEREIDLVASLQHPNIVTVYDSGLTHGHHYFAMEYIHGQSLDVYLSNNKLSIDRMLRLFRKICSAVNAAHQRGVIHRDLKPGNIRVDAEGEPHVLDFGLAKAAGSNLQGGAPVTMSGEFMGTLAYASPEQTRGDPNLVDIRTDVYSLGVILFEMLTGKFPYQVVGHFADVLNNIAEVEPERPSTICRQINNEVETIVLKALAKEKERRYQSAEALAHDVGRYLAGEAIEAKRNSAFYMLRKSLRRYRFVAGVAFAFVLVLAVSTIALSIMYRNQSVAREEADRSRSLAHRRYEEIIRLADLKRLDDAIATAQELWPAYPDKIPAMETWLETRAVPLRDNLPKHVATLEALRDQALEYDAVQERRDRQTHPKAAELARQKRRLFELQKEREDLAAIEGEVTEEEARRIERVGIHLAEAEQSVATLTEEVEQRRTWLLPDEGAQWQHDLLAELVDGLRRFVSDDPAVGTLRNVEDRLDFARGVTDRSITGAEAAAAWDRAITDIARLEVYHGLRLTPQLGLIPLRRDPRSGLWEFLHIQTGTRPEPNPEEDAANPWILTADTGLIFVLIPGGNYWMGAQNEDPARRHYDPLADPDETPVHEVALDPFFISKYEMTQSQWERFTGYNPSSLGPDWNSMGKPSGGVILHQNEPWSPVEMVSWTDCRDVLGQLGLVFPTEAQWECAARGGTDSAWWSGNELESINTQQAGNLADSLTKSRGGPTSWPYEEALEDPCLVHCPVGRFRPNGYGLHDTIGNVKEWCRDAYQSYEKDGRPGDGLRELGDNPSRVNRGGSYTYNARVARSANRNCAPSGYVNDSVGVRPARIITD